MRRRNGFWLALWGILTVATTTGTSVAAATTDELTGEASAEVGSGLPPEKEPEEDDRLAIEKFGFCWTRVVGVKAPICTEITRAADDFWDKCHAWAREQHGYRYGTFKDAILSRLQSKQRDFCGSVLPVIKKFECGEEILCPGATNSSIARIPFGTFVMAKTEPQAVNLCLSAVPASYIYELKPERLAAGCYLRPVADPR